MAESDKANSLSEDYLLKDIEEKLKVDSEPEEKSAVVAAPVESADEENAPASEDSSSQSSDSEEENVSGPPPAADEDVTDPTPTEETTETADEGDTQNETPEIKLETAPGDYRFPTTNQSRHCFTRYVEYHRCVAAKGEDTSECDKFAKYYRALCPGEWVDRWNEQRENGTFPGPL